MANLAGADEPADRPIDGVNIEAVFRGEQLKKPSLCFWAMPTDTDVEYVVRKNNWKTFLSIKNYKPVELYNLTDDPLEFFNLLQEEKMVAKDLQDSFYQYESDP